MNWKKLSIILLVHPFIYITVKGQGCSDAGFCTMGAMKPDQVFNKNVKIKLRSVELSYYSGQTTLTPVVTVFNLDAGVSITKNLSAQIKIPYQSVSGSLDNTSGMGDISFSITQRLIDTDKFDFSATLGTKIPTNKSDLKSSGVKQP